MIPTPNCEWVCRNCGKRISGHYDEDYPGSAFKLCPKCNKQMELQQMVHKGPFFRKHPFRHD